jgi:hypothetical protein
MMVQKLADLAKVEAAELGKAKPTKHTDHVAISMFDKVMGKCQADIKAIDLLDEDQKEYLSRNAKVFLAARMKKIKRRLKK